MKFKSQMKQSRDGNTYLRCGKLREYDQLDEKGETREGLGCFFSSVLSFQEIHSLQGNCRVTQPTDAKLINAFHPLAKATGSETGT